MIPGQTPQPKKKLDKPTFIMLILLIIVTVAALGIVCYMTGTKHAARYAVDFTISEIKADKREPKYKIMPAEFSNYICDMCEGLEMDSDKAVAHLMVENPNFDPEAIHKNVNGTIDEGLFQLNDRSTWTSFVKKYWFDNIEFNPFNWKHNTYIALHHMKYLEDKFKVEDDAIMAYNCGEGNVMNGTIPESTKVYLAKVKNNLYLLKSSNQRGEMMIGYIIGGVLALLICLVIHYWNKENKE